MRSISGSAPTPPRSCSRNSACCRGSACSAAALISAVIAMALGYPCFRLRGHYFVIATIVIAEIALLLIPELGLGGRGARHRHSRARRQLAQIPVHAQQAAVFLLRAGPGLRRLVRHLVAGRFQMGLLVARGEGQSGRRRKPRRRRVQFQDGGGRGLGVPHRDRRRLLRAVRLLYRSRKRHGLPVLAADGAARGAWRHRHAVGADAGRGHPDPAHRTDALLHRRLRPRRRPDRLWRR